jgi:hypothetical protein
MQLASEIIVGVITGVVSLGLLCILFRIIFSRLSEKLDISQFNEYVANVKDNFESGQRRFDKIDAALAKNTEALNLVCVSIKGLTVLLEQIEKKVDKQ